MIIPFSFGHMLGKLVVVVIQDTNVHIELHDGPEANLFRGRAWNKKELGICSSFNIIYIFYIIVYLFLI